MNEKQAIQWLAALDEEFESKKNGDLTSVERFILALQRDEIIKDQISKLEKKVGGEVFATDLESQVVTGSTPIDPRLVVPYEENQKALNLLRFASTAERNRHQYISFAPSYTTPLDTAQSELYDDFYGSKFTKAFVELLRKRKTQFNEWQLDGEKLERTFHDLFNDPTHGAITSKSLDLQRCSLTAFDKMPIEKQRNVLSQAISKISNNRGFSDSNRLHLSIPYSDPDFTYSQTIIN